MSINPYNHEHYHDPTPFEALTRVEQAARNTSYRPMVFICSPYAGDIDRNVENARAFSRFAVHRNCIPLAPHLLFPQFMDDEDRKQRELAIFMGMVLMSKCREVWVFGEKVTQGMSMEIERATRRGIPIRYFNEECQEVMTDGSTDE